MRRSTTFLLAALLSFSPAYAQQAADGLIVPFSSVLPSCASQCGKLFDVQGACTPPNIATTSSSCFCSDPRLTPFLQGTTGVSSVCGAASCTAASDLQTIETWYQSYCGQKQTGATTTIPGGSAATGTGTSGSQSSSTPGSSSSSAPKGWFAIHYKWVIMLLVLFFGIIFLWIAACLLRRRHIRKKEKEIEMRPPVAWGPHQLQGMTGGYNYGDGVADAGRGGRSHGSGGHHKEGMLEAQNMAVATPADGTRGKRESKGWLRKNPK